MSRRNIPVRHRHAAEIYGPVAAKSFEARGAGQTPAEGYSSVGRDSGTALTLNGKRTEDCSCKISIVKLDGMSGPWSSHHQIWNHGILLGKQTMF
jgi:hypothetical protein